MENIKVTQQQRDNALEALNVMWPSVPSKNVVRGLQTWREDDEGAAPDCGTVACFGGWCAWWPTFRRQGVRTNSYGAPTHRRLLDVSEFLFGDGDLFNVRSFHRADWIFNGTDHALVSNRLRWLIKNSTVVEPNKPRKTASGS